METPAGFELNSAQVVGRVGEFMASRLQNYKPVIDIVPARKKGSAFSPDDPEVLKPLPVCQPDLHGTRQPDLRHPPIKGYPGLGHDPRPSPARRSADLCPAATISVGAHALPVYEVYKVGQDMHVVDGLDFFRDFGLHLSFVPHWNNADGGVDLDTSRCFVGMDRFADWCGMVPLENTTVGLDEHTGILLDFEKGVCEVSGVSSVSLVRQCIPEKHPAGATFDLKELGDLQIPSPLEKNIPGHVWEMVCNPPPLEELPPESVVDLADKRLQARMNRQWEESDRLRSEIATLGWMVQDAKRVIRW